MARNRDTDACPGALSLHQAADGALARIRLPGGVLTSAQLQALAVLARDAGSGALELTSRGNVQIRGITDVALVADTVAAVGLLPSATHEKVRNIVASPLSGRVGDHADVRGVTEELDAALQSDPELAQLPGRFWFGLDDGRGDIAGLATDLGARFSGQTAELQVTGRGTGLHVPAAGVVAALLDGARRFLEIRGTAWRASELTDPAALFDHAELGPPTDPVSIPPVGWFTQNDGRITLGAAVALGVLPARTAEFLAAIEAPLVVTPWRSVLVCDLDEGVADTALRVLAPMDLIFDENSPWLSVSSCTGSPGCDRSLADVRADAIRAVASGDTPDAGHRHYVGCERACGSPVDGEVLVATGDGYRARERHP